MLGRIALWCAIVTFAVSAEHWSLKTHDDGVYCLLIEANATVKVTYQVGTATGTFSFAINASTVDTVKSNCFGPVINGTYPTLKLKVDFLPSGVTPAQSPESELWSLEILFIRMDDHFSFELYDYTLTTAPISGAYTKTETFHKSANADINFAAGNGNGFKCSTSILALERDSTITLTEVRAIAMLFFDKDEFPADQVFEQCHLDTTRAAEVLAACLVVLVIVALIAYLIGRARGRRQGYASL